jgi:hypothetical protein
LWHKVYWNLVSSFSVNFNNRLTNLTCLYSFKRRVVDLVYISDLTNKASRE